MDRPYTVSRYLLHRLKEVGVNHLFGVPGDYNLDFLDEVMLSPIKWIGNCNELNAGYAADGYARLNGIGAAVVTYGVGGLSIINAVAGAFAELVPIIVINGAPPARRREAGAMVHHLVSNYYLQLDIFKKITADAALLTDPNTAPDEIDRVLKNAVLQKLPGYIELPADMNNVPCRAPEKPLTMLHPTSDPDSLAECVKEAVEMINKAESPIFLAGLEVLRFGLGKETLQLIETSEVPFSTMLSSKSVLPELHPQFTGIYQGGWSKPSTRHQVEDSDCLISLGAWMTDLDTGLFSINLDSRRMITVGGGQVRIGSHFYHQVQLGDFIRGLSLKIQPRSYLASHPAESYRPKQPFVPESSRMLTAKRLYECLNFNLNDQLILLSEPGDSFCASPEFHIEEAENYIVQSYYCSIGFCTPAALGVSLARPSKRPVVLTGDGAFQMTAQEISTLIREKCPAIVILVNNDGYLIERYLHQDGRYNDIQMWNYAALPGVLGNNDAVVGIKVSTEEELEKAMLTALKTTDKLIFIEACIVNRDASFGLERLGNTFRSAQQKK
ncbi:MAG TPA: thiamine pyrophosphate-binding protein [Bacteroidales bacterium]|nr:thiamine pyrophosphate-binding protein [Bacteroidales bacterium]HPS49120.1 thiamine pyrophosphate-binding protein [Bacteroidales bacterium]